jgi:ferredoxin
MICLIIIINQADIPESMAMKRLISDGVGRFACFVRGRGFFSINVMEEQVSKSSNGYSKRIVLHFTKDIWETPIVYRLVKDYNLIFNILKANILPRQESYLVLELIGDTKQDFDRGIDYLRRSGVSIQPVEKDIRWLEKKCVQCGACASICPSGAFIIDRGNNMMIHFDPNLCSACSLCVKGCPVRAIEAEL